MILIHIDGIKGDSQIPGYKDKDWFAVDSFEFGVVRETKESAKAGTDDLTIGVGELSVCTFQKTTDRASLKLMHHSISGGPLPSAEIHFVQTKDNADSKQAVFPYLMFKLIPCFIKEWKISGSEDGRPTEDVSLWYQKIAMQYYAYTKIDGKYVSKTEGTAGWDQVVNNSWDTPKFEVPQG